MSSSNPFTDPTILDGQSFSHGLSSFSPEQDQLNEFVEDDEMVIFCDEGGRTHVAKQILLYEKTDPINSTITPTFSQGNKFVEGLGDALSASFVPAGAIILFSNGEMSALAAKKIPSGWVACDGNFYISKDKKVWFTPTLTPVGDAIYIQKLPAGYVKTSLFELVAQGITVI